MTPRERFIRALRREPLTGQVPTFELVFFLTMELLGKVHPSQRRFEQWGQMSVREKELHLRDMAQMYLDVAEHYSHSAIFLHPNPGSLDETVRLIEIVRELSGDKYFLLLDRDPTFSMPDGKNMIDFSVRLYEEMDQLKEEGERRAEGILNWAYQLRQRGASLDGFAMCSDYCFNVNPFFSPEMFAELNFPLLKKTVDGFHEMGYYAIKHTDGNIMPIIDQLVDSGADALHSIDPQAGVDLKEVKNLYGDRICLIGNVNCGLLQTGTDEEAIADVKRSLADGMPGYGYIFSTSNCVYTGMPLERYELMNRIWREYGVYPENV